MSPERAAEVCEDRARAAMGPRGTVGIGITNEGPRAGASIGLSLDYLKGRDPLEVYDSCVRANTGQPPIRPPVL